MRLICVALSCLQVKIANYYVEIDTMTSKNKSMSSIFELNQDTPDIIHGISLGPMQLIFVELSYLQVKIANFHVEIDPHDLKK